MFSILLFICNLSIARIIANQYLDGRVHASWPCNPFYFKHQKLISYKVCIIFQSSLAFSRKRRKLFNKSKLETKKERKRISSCYSKAILFSLHSSFSHKTHFYKWQKPPFPSSSTPTHNSNLKTITIFSIFTSNHVPEYPPAPSCYRQRYPKNENFSLLLVPNLPKNLEVLLHTTPT